MSKAPAVDVVANKIMQSNVPLIGSKYENIPPVYLRSASYKIIFNW